MLTDWWAAIVPHLNRRKASCGLSPAPLLPSSTPSELPLLNSYSFSQSALFFFHVLFYFDFADIPHLLCSLIHCSFPPLCKSDFISLSFSLTSCCLVLPPPWLSPHHASVIPTLPPFLSPDCMYPSIRVWSATSDLAGHILCASICWLDLQFHFINIVILFTIVFPLCLRLFLSRPSSFCHRLGVPANPSSLITFPTSNPRARSADDLWWKACSRFKAKFPQQS